MNYQQIRTAALGYADRTKDTEVTNLFDTFLRVVESQVNQRLAVREMSVRTRIAVNPNQEYYGLPADFGGLRDIEFATSGDASTVTLEYLNPKQLNDYKARGLTGTRFYTIIADQLQIALPPEEGFLEIVYMRDVPPLTSDSGSDTNWLSESAPEAYIFGLCAEIAAFAKDAPALEIWAARFEKALDQIDYDDASSRWSGTSLRVRLG